MRSRHIGRLALLRTENLKNIIHLSRTAGGWTLILCLSCIVFYAPAWGQLSRASKLPGIGKITNSGPGEEAFTGAIQSFNRKQHVLNVSAVESNDIEIFPISKKVRVASIEGSKLKLVSLKPGATVVVYYQDKQGRRTVSRIVVLSAAASAKGKPAGSS